MNLTEAMIVIAEQREEIEELTIQLAQITDEKTEYLEDLTKLQKEKIETMKKQCENCRVKSIKGRPP